MVAPVVLVVTLDERYDTEVFQAASRRCQLLTTTHSVPASVLEEIDEDGMNRTKSLANQLHVQLYMYAVRYQEIYMYHKVKEKLLQI